MITTGLAQKTSIEDIDHYFETFLHAYFDDTFIAALPSRDDTVSFSIECGRRTSDWQVRCSEGRLVCERTTEAPSRCQYTLTADDFLQIVQAQLRPQTAFFTRRLHIGGDVLYALRLGALLECFFRQHPYRNEA